MLLSTSWAPMFSWKAQITWCEAYIGLRLLSIQKHKYIYNFDFLNSNLYRALLRIKLSEVQLIFGEAYIELRLLSIQKKHKHPYTPYLNLHFISLTLTSDICSISKLLYTPLNKTMYSMSVESTIYRRNIWIDIPSCGNHANETQHPLKRIIFCPF